MPPKAKAKSWSWGDDVDSFPAGMWDDFDGELFDIQYIPGDYGTQIQGFVRPVDYEYESRDYDIPEDSELMDEGQGTPRFWYGMGGDEDTYEISEDGMEITGPPPFKTTRAVKGMKAIEGALKIRMTSLNLSQVMSQNPCHWKITEEKGRNRETKENFSTPVLYASGPAVGESLYGKQSAGKATTTRASSRKAAPPATATTEEGESEKAEIITEDKPQVRTPRSRQSDAATTTRPSNGRRARSASPPTEEVETPEPPSANGTADELTLKSMEAVRSMVDEMGEGGVKKTRLVGLAMSQEEEHGEDVVEKIAERDFVDEAVASGILVEEDGVLRVGEKEALAALYE